MKRIPELIWEAALAMIAFAGAFVLLKEILSFIPEWVYGLFFAISFVIMIIGWIWRFIESKNLITIETNNIYFNIEEPIIIISIGFLAKEKITINKTLYIHIEKSIEQKLKEIYIPFTHIKDLKIQYPEGMNDKQYIILTAGDYFSASCEIKLYKKNSYTDHKLKQIKFKNNIKIGIYIEGYKRFWFKPDIEII